MTEGGDRNAGRFSHLKDGLAGLKGVGGAVDENGAVRHVHEPPLDDPLSCGAPAADVGERVLCERMYLFGTLFLDAAWTIRAGQDPLCLKCHNG
ncbi:hypothetical protein DSLASN_45340 [Desulfoluna limicola]|uniref:Uncharacterized protein n=1 Tax=Desulfoluna limicola TaxID=2810562 RepID=A0ABN6FBK4_9BACT|nr:hypothetical protein DSLASN_45340 [Desulfoluna limicola]